MKIKKYTLIIIIAFIAIASLTACDSNKKSITTATDSSKQEETCKKDDKDKDKILCFNVSGGHEAANYYIDQEDKTTAVLHFPYMDFGVNKIVDINTTVDTLSNGEPSENAKSDAKYSYLTKWKLYHEFEQIRDAFSVSCAGSSVDFSKDWTTRSAGYLEFDLSTLNEDGTFSVDLSYGYNHPKGNVEKVPTATAKCIGVQFGGSDIDLSAYKGVMKGVWKGKISDMTADSAKITIDNCCLYNHCNTQDGAKFQTIADPVTLYIKKGKGK